MSSIVRAALRLDASEPSWLEELHFEASKELARGLGLLAYTYEVSGDAITLQGSVTNGAPPGFWEALGAWGAENTPAIAALYRRGFSVGTLADARRMARSSRLELAPHPPSFRASGVRDLVTIVAHRQHGSRGAGCVLAAPREKGTELDSSERRALARIAKAVALGFELRRARTRPVVVAELSLRERAVARRVAGGASDKVIAHELGISVHTVSTYVRRALGKLGLAAREQLASVSWDDGSRLGSGAAAAAARLDLLSPAELEIAADVVRGRSNAEIACTRGTSLRTVACQVASVFAKLDVGSRTELAALLFGATGGSMSRK